jgi:hypothetical protein
MALDQLWRERGNRPKRRPAQDWHQLGGAFVFARADGSCGAT